MVINNVTWQITYLICTPWSTHQDMGDPQQHTGHTRHASITLFPACTPEQSGPSTNDPPLPSSSQHSDLAHILLLIQHIGLI